MRIIQKKNSTFPIGEVSKSFKELRTISFWMLAATAVNKQEIAVSLQRENSLKQVIEAGRGGLFQVLKPREVTILRASEVGSGTLRVLVYSPVKEENLQITHLIKSVPSRKYSCWLI